MARLVDRGHLLLARGQLHWLLEADLLDELGLPQVVPPQRVATVLKGEDQGLVHHVLDHRR